MNKIKTLREINHFCIVFIFACGYMIISFRVLNFFRGGRLKILLDSIFEYSSLSIEIALYFIAASAVVLIFRNEYSVYLELKRLNQRGGSIDKFIVYKENYHIYVNSFIVLFVLCFILLNISSIRDLLSGDISHLLFPTSNPRTTR
jgi:hypothetical protein